jgi:hypothetical protein
LISKIFKPAIPAIALWACAIPSWAAPTEGAEVLGWIERVVVEDAGFAVEAKLDTGADHSSLSATNIRRVRVGDKRYVRYSVRHPETGELLSIRSPYLRNTRIRSHSGVSQRRRVVEMTICLGHHRRIVEVNLIDRTVFDYPLLLGRSALEGIAIVDPSVTHLSEPECKEEQG